MIRAACDSPAPGGGAGANSGNGERVGTAAHASGPPGKKVVPNSSVKIIGLL